MLFRFLNISFLLFILTSRLVTLTLYKWDLSNIPSKLFTSSLILLISLFCLHNDLVIDFILRVLTSSLCSKQLSLVSCVK